MKKNRRILTLLLVLALLTTILTAVHLHTRTQVPKGVLILVAQSQTTEITLSNLSLDAVEGTVVNGKGEEKFVSGQGVLLSRLLEQYQITEYASVNVIADDEYSAAVTREEILAPDQVYLLIEEDGSVRMAVFGDLNSKRQVSGVVRLEVA